MSCVSSSTAAAVTTSVGVAATITGKSPKFHSSTTNVKNVIKFPRIARTTISKPPPLLLPLKRLKLDFHRVKRRQKESSIHLTFPSLPPASLRHQWNYNYRYKHKSISSSYSSAHPAVLVAPLSSICAANLPLKGHRFYHSGDAATGDALCIKGGGQLQRQLLRLTQFKRIANRGFQTSARREVVKPYLLADIGEGVYMFSYSSYPQLSQIEGFPGNHTRLSISN